MIIIVVTLREEDFLDKEHTLKVWEAINKRLPEVPWERFWDQSRIITESIFEIPGERYTIQIPMRCLLFKKINWTWKPEWKKRKELLLRKIKW